MALGFFVVSGVKTEKAAMDYSPKFSSGQMATESAEYRNIVSSISSKAQDELDSYRKQTALEFSSSTGGSMSGSETERLLFTFPEIPEFSILSQNGWSNSGKYLIIKTEDINRL